MKFIRILKHKWNRPLISDTALCAAMAFWAVLNACSPVTESPGLAGPCTETGNPTGIKGKVVDGSGIPVSGALVKLLQRSGTDSSGQAAILSQTASCSDGSFGFTKLAASSYALEAIDSTSGKVSWISKADIADSTTTLRLILTLMTPGGINVTVTRGANPRPAGIFGNEKIVVRLIQTDKSWLTDSSGLVAAHFIAPGLYRASFTALDGHYLTAYVDSISVLAGQTTTLPRVDLEWSPFVSPPVPALPTMDTLSASVMRIHWHRVYVSNLSHYELQRLDSLSPNLSDTLRVTDTLYLDSLRTIFQGHPIEYRVRSVNKLGNKSDWSAGLVTQVPVETVSTGPLALDIHVTLNGADAVKAKVSLFSLPAYPGAPDSLPIPVRQEQFALTARTGSVRFEKIAPGRYGIEAIDTLTSRKAYQFFTARTDTSLNLDLQPTGAIRGTVSRQNLWVTTPFKGDENIQVSLAGTPYVFYSDYKGAFKLTGIPSGVYDLVIFAPPEGYFLVNTVKGIKVLAKDTTSLPLVLAAYNPSAPPPKINTLNILASSGRKVTLQWQPIVNYPFLKAYEVIRMDEASNILTVSGPVSATSWEDDLTGGTAGTRVLYAIRILTTAGKSGENGGDSYGKPIPFLIPN